MDRSGAPLENVHSAATFECGRQFGFRSLGVTDDARASVGEGFAQGFFEGFAVAGGPNSRIRNGSKEGQVKHTVMGSSIFADESSTVQTQNHRQVLQRHIVNPLVHSALRKGTVEVDHGPQTRRGHSGGLGHHMPFRDAPVKKAVGERFPEAIQATSWGHRCSQSYDTSVFGRQVDQAFGKMRLEMPRTRNRLGQAQFLEGGALRLDVQNSGSRRLKCML